MPEAGLNLLEKASAVASKLNMTITHRRIDVPAGAMRLHFRCVQRGNARVKSWWSALTRPVKMQNDRGFGQKFRSAGLNNNA